jgi:hypothetical protein
MAALWELAAWPASVESGRGVVGQGGDRFAETTSPSATSRVQAAEIHPSGVSVIGVDVLCDVASA